MAVQCLPLLFLNLDFHKLDVSKQDYKVSCLFVFQWSFLAAEELYTHHNEHIQAIAKYCLPRPGRPYQSLFIPRVCKGAAMGAAVGIHFHSFSSSEKVAH